MGVEKSIEERKRALMLKLETIKREQISETVFMFPGRYGKLFEIDTNLVEFIHGITFGQFITTYCWNDKLNLCVGTGKGDRVCLGQQVLYFLVEGIDEVTHFHLQGQGINNFKQLQEIVKAVLVE